MSVFSIRWSARRWERDTPFLCRLFGHKWNSGWYGDRPYFKPASLQGTVDNIGREHITLNCECMRCDQKLPVGYIHNLWRIPDAHLK